MNYPQFWLKATHKQKRFYSLIFMFILAVAATLIGLAIPVSAEEARMINDMLNQTVTEGTAAGTLPQDIFINNFSLCLLMFVPLAGAAIGLFILFSTGQAFRAVFEIQAGNFAATPAPGVSGTPIPTLSPTPLPSISPETAILTLGLIGAVFLLEYVSYTIAMTESVWLFRRIMQWRAKMELRREVKYLLVFIGVAALMLVIGAFVETYALSVGT
ncbi:MAG: hypothetical protein ACQCN6_05560 [Candidatus Bathyarchaeia archaeon]|jgi:hypothetical protein